MTGLGRYSIAVISVPILAASVAVAFLLSGALGFCGLSENAAASGYCAAGSAIRLSLVAVPCTTVIAGCVLTFWRARLTPVLLAAMIALGEGLIELGLGY